MRKVILEVAGQIAAACDRLEQIVKSAEKAGPDAAANYVEQLVMEKKSLQKKIAQLSSRSISALDEVTDPEERARLKAQLAAALLPHEVKESDTKSGKRAPLTGCVSFRQELAMRSARGQVARGNAEWRVNNKVKAVKYVKRLGIHVPKQYGRYPLEDLPELTNRVLKPVSGAGSKGVFLIGDGQMLDVKQRERFSSMDELFARAGQLGKKQWTVEELISGHADEPYPARDLKFYMFYGKVALVLEVDRYPETRYCWWDGEQQRVATGKYDNSLFEGEGFSEEDRAIAEKISLSIPAPFCRIDLLKGHSKTVFGEITPRPGSFQDFSDEMDYLLGREFMLAEARLRKDLLNGVSFSSIFSK